jgi:plastocyanin
MNLSLKLAAVAGVAAIAAVPPVVAQGASKKTVTVHNFKFAPAKVTIKKGQSVTWKFVKDPAPHNVKGSGGIKSKAKITSGSYTKKFTKAGSFKYVCGFHPNMKGTVVVK